MSKPQYQQKFKRAWLKDPFMKDWLQEISSTNGSVTKCSLCHCTIANKYSDLKNHGLSKKHKVNADLILDQRQLKIPFVQEKSLDSAKRAECRLCRFVACHTAIISMNHLVSVCKDSFHCDASNYLQVHRTKCSAIIRNVIAPFFMDDLRDDIGDAPYSLLLDESTDIAIQKYLGVSIIYFSKKMSRIVSTSLELGELKYKLKIGMLQGVGIDNASVMVGIDNGVYQKLKVHCPNLLVKCVCHSLQLATSAAVKELPRNLDFLIKETGESTLYGNSNFSKIWKNTYI